MERKMVFMIMMIMLQMSASTEFNCDFDICNTDLDQYCDEADRRCNYCICGLPQTQSVIPECQEICAKKAVTTTPKPTTSLAPSSQNLGSGNNTYLNSIILAVIIIGIIILICIYLYRTKKCCFKTQTPNSTPTSSTMSSDESLLKDKPKDFEINMGHSPIYRKKSPTQEEGYKLIDGADQIHTSPTADVDFDQHKRVFADPDEIAITKNKQAESEETSLKRFS